MQSRLENGTVIVSYKDGSRETLSLRNPTTWWPIERDYYTDQYAFHSEFQIPFRLHLKTGRAYRKFDNYTSIDGVTSRAIEGGAATILDLPLDETKNLSTLQIKAKANDVIIGLMSITLLRN